MLYFCVVDAVVVAGADATVVVVVVAAALVYSFKLVGHCGLHFRTSPIFAASVTVAHFNTNVNRATNVPNARRQKTIEVCCPWGLFW